MTFNNEMAADAADILEDLSDDITIDGAPGTGWFVDEFHQVDIGEGLINTTQPMIIVATGATPIIREGSAIVHKVAAYVVIGPPVVTGVGLAINYLQKVSP